MIIVPLVIVAGSSPRITMRAPISRVQALVWRVGLSLWHMLPEETTRIGYSVLSARRMPPQTAMAPRITIPTRNKPRAVSFFLR